MGGTGVATACRLHVGFVDGGASDVCGIVGYTHKNWSPGPERIQSAVATLFHRGPDQQGVFTSSTVSLGATRLKIIDLTSGNQPILSEGGDTVIVFNGE